jgi:enamine deaminase RidA (YjgF/YER057c/UK114 family)
MSIQPPDAIFDPYKRLEELGLKLDTRKLRAEWFDATRRSGDLLFTSGQIAANADGPLYRGRLGMELTTEQGRDSAQLAMLNVLSLVHQSTGDLRLWRAFKITVACSATPDFAEIGEVVNGASLLLVDVFGPVFGAHARTGVSNIALAGGSAVEVEAIFQLRG